jgi:hypothetical protein
LSDDDEDSPSGGSGGGGGQFSEEGEDFPEVTAEEAALFEAMERGY